MKPRLRFAVGTFDSWPQLRNAPRDLRARGVVLSSFNCLALQREFAGKSVRAPDQGTLAIKALSFPDRGELIACTAGPLADRLVERIAQGASSLKASLGHWLVARHAADFEKAVEAGNILFWIEVADGDEERRACRSLLAHSCSSVGVQDLVLPGER